MQIGLVLAFPLHNPKVPGSRLGVVRWVFVIQNLSDYIKSEKAKDWLRGAGQLSTALNDTPCIVKNLTEYKGFEAEAGKFLEDWSCEV